MRRKSRIAGVDDWGFPVRGHVASPEDVDFGRRHGQGTPKYEGVLGGLRVLSRNRRPGERFSLSKIAKACGCCEEHIRRIEFKARKRVREALEGDPDFKGLMRELGERVSGRMFEMFMTTTQGQ